MKYYRYGDTILQIPEALLYNTPTGRQKTGPGVTPKGNLSSRYKIKSVKIEKSDDGKFHLIPGKEYEVEAKKPKPKPQPKAKPKQEPKQDIKNSKEFIEQVQKKLLKKIPNGKFLYYEADRFNFTPEKQVPNYTYGWASYKNGDISAEQADLFLIYNPKFKNILNPVTDKVQAREVKICYYFPFAEETICRDIEIWKKDRKNTDKDNIDFQVVNDFGYLYTQDIKNKLKEAKGNISNYMKQQVKAEQKQQPKAKPKAQPKPQTKPQKLEGIVYPFTKDFNYIDDIITEEAKKCLEDPNWTVGRNLDFDQTMIITSFQNLKLCDVFYPPYGNDLRYRTKDEMTEQKQTGKYENIEMRANQTITVKEKNKEGVPYWTDQFKDLVKKNKKRFIMINLSIFIPGAYHQDSILIDTKHKTMERYEPHGGVNVNWSIDLDENLFKLAEDLGLSYEMNEGGFIKDNVDMKKFKKSLTPNQLKYVQMKSKSFKVVNGEPEIVLGDEIINGDLGWQEMEKIILKDVNKPFLKKFIGCCQAWSMLYLHLRILNPDLSAKEVMKGFCHGLDSDIQKISKFILGYTILIERQNSILLDEGIFRFFGEKKMPNLNFVINKIAKTMNLQKEYPPLPPEPKYKGVGIIHKDPVKKPKKGGGRYDDYTIEELEEILRLQTLQLQGYFGELSRELRNNIERENEEIRQTLQRRRDDNILNNAKQASEQHKKNQDSNSGEADIPGKDDIPNNKPPPAQKKKKNEMNLVIGNPTISPENLRLNHLIEAVWVYANRQSPERRDEILRQMNYIVDRYESNLIGFRDLENFLIRLMRIQGGNIGNIWKYIKEILSRWFLKKEQGQGPVHNTSDQDEEDITAWQRIPHEKPSAEPYRGV